MEVNWRNNETHESAILFKRQAVFDEFSVRHVKVLAGEMPRHNAEHHELNLTLNGKLSTQRHTSNGKKRIDCGMADYMCVTPFGQTIEANWEDEYESVMVEFTPTYLAKMANQMNLSANVELRDTVAQKDLLIQQLSLAFLAENDKNEISSKLYADSIAHTLMFHIVKNYTNAVEYGKQFIGGLSGRKLRLVKEFINDNLDQDLTLTEIAEVADLSHFHFARAFRKSTNVTPQQYIVNCRIEKAKELLIKSNLPIVEVGFQTGFKNQSHFTTLFRKITSFTPKIWREANQM
ncbi:MAG: AraC family transcriptional regulator [Pyrinomonadaceae bacterium]|jgi:AraC family transcriptional regulator|nr:AraC family transcriptional regulator [Pyrinomonadaceae bacterium]